YALHHLPAHVAARLWLRPGQCRARYAGAASMARPQEHPAHGQVHRAGAGQVQKLLARLGSRFPLIVYDASFPGHAGRTAAGWRRQGDGAGNKWGYERVYALTKLPLAGVLPWLSRPTWTASTPIPKPSEFSMSRLK